MPIGINFFIYYKRPMSTLTVNPLVDIKDLTEEIMLKVDIRDIARLCRSSKAFDRVCRSDWFWRRRYEQDYGSDAPINIPAGTWKEAYRMRYQGKLYMFGGNSAGQLGTGDNIDRLVPTEIRRLTNVIQVSCGNSYTGVVTGTDGGQLYMFGFNLNGRLGIGSGGYGSKIPIHIKSLTNVTSVSCGGSHTGVITEGGGLWMFGDNYYGQLGNGTFAKSTVPIKITSANVVQVSCGNNHTGVITANNKLWMFGNNSYGQLGNGTVANSNVPIEINLVDGQVDGQVDGLANPVQVSCGNGYTGVLTREGHLYMFGSNEIGELGYGRVRRSYTPVKLEGLNDIIQISCGHHHTGAITSDGRLYMFGNNRVGQLGIIGRPVFREPVEVTRVNGVAQVSCGADHSAVIDRNGDVHFFGRDIHGQLSDRIIMPEARMISCGANHLGIIGYLGE